MKLTLFVVLAFAALAFACKEHLNRVVPDDLCPQHIGPPCPRYVNNTYPDYRHGDPVVITSEMRQKMTDLLAQYSAIVLKNMGPAVNDSDDDGFSVYGGHVGRALLYLRLWKNEHSASRDQYFQQAKQYLDAGLTYLPAPPGQIGFSDAEDGARAVEAVIYDIVGDKARVEAAIAKVTARFNDFSDVQSDTFLPGLSGLIYTGLFLNNHFKREVIPQALMMNVAKKVIADGAKLGGGKSLVYTDAPWGTDITLGAGAGGAGVIRVLQDLPQVMQDPATRVLVKNTLDSFVAQQYQDGNFPQMHTPAHELYAMVHNAKAMKRAAAGDDDDWVLVQWCHGAPGMVLPLLQGYVNFRNESYLRAAEKALDAIWKRGLLTKGMMLCHGIAANAYTFLAHYRLTGDLKSLYRALRFTEFTLDPANVKLLRIPDQPYALYAGSYTGAMTLYSDLLADPKNAKQLSWDLDI